MFKFIEMNIFNTMILVIVATVLSCCNSSSQQKICDLKNVEISTDTSFNFDNYNPVDWQMAVTGKGKMCDWNLIDDAGNKVLAQVSSERPDYRFNIITNKYLNYRDIDISVKFKGVNGKGDQGGGPVWRYIDENNYYVARANPLENNFRLYKVVNGNRIELKSANVDINSHQWYKLRIVMQGNKIQCYFNDKLELETRDTAFLNAGRIGLWTKSDAVTYFDDFIVNTVK